MGNTKGNIHENKRSLESFMLVNGKPGDMFYTTKKAKDMTAISHYYRKQILTEAMIVVNNLRREPKAERITKVTIL